MTEQSKDPIELFFHVDKKVDLVKGEIWNIREMEIEIKKMVEKIEDRVDNGVSRTGQENKTTLAEHSVKLAELSHEIKDIGSIVISETKTLRDSIDTVSERTNLIYKGIVGIFFTILLGGFIGFMFKELPTWFK